ncbi:MAG: glucosaminidase domain-containing protein [Bacteroidales bacterium]|nr:glucosaminidase domain-containing protein [Bacteroidales bacterium]
MSIKSIARGVCLAATVLLSCFMLQADDLRREYIRQWSETAVEQMIASGVPASITLAQACLESANGTSTLARQANNHFGIKCRGWSGPAFRHDDDLKDECFRSYDNAEESFCDHSDFLRYNDRYASLFDLDPTDYKGWARGLKKAGYATDPAYAEKLIKIIEDYRLYEYDVIKPRKGGTSVSLPPSPVTLEKVSKVDAPLHFRPRSLGSVTIDYTFYEKHGLVYIVANGTEDYASLARQFNLFRRELLRFNDEKRDHIIPAGEMIYLQPKRNQSTADLAKHVVEEGETMRGLSQRFGVKLKNLYKFNNMKPGREPAPGTIINLRKVKK